MHFRVLVVDDEPAICRLIALYLQELRIHGEFANDGRSALTTFERDPQAFDALLLDLNLPNISGTFLLEAARRVRPEIPAVLMSGSADIHWSDDAAPHPAYSFLSKPFSAASLLDAITFASLLSEVGAYEAAQGAAVERREHRRYYGKASGVLKAVGPSPNLIESPASVVDVCTAGAGLRTERAFAVGTEIMLRMRTVSLHGHVLRCKARESGFCVGMRVEQVLAEYGSRPRRRAPAGEGGNPRSITRAKG